MRKLVLTPLVCLLLASLLLTQTMITAIGQTSDRFYSIKSKITYANPVDGDRIWNLTEIDRTIGLFMNDTWQTVELRSATYALEAVETDEDGNKIGILNLPVEQLFRGENVSYTVEYGVVAKPRTIANISETESGTIGSIPFDVAQIYTRSEGPWLIDNLTLVDLAHEIAGNETNVLKIVRQAIDWIRQNIVYVAHDTPMYANQTLSEGVGDCDDQAVLLITLLRILGIPSHLQIGAVYVPQNVEVTQNSWGNHVQTVQRKIGWHGWAMVYVPPWEWLPVDLTYVFSSFEDPLDAIRYSAVAKQTTVQYLNISRVDYVADSLETKDFLTRNGFVVYVEDEMIDETQSDGSGGFNPIATAILVVVVVLVALPVIYILIVRRRKRKLEEQKPSSIEIL